MNKVKELKKYERQLGHTLVQLGNWFWEISTVRLLEGDSTDPRESLASLVDRLFKMDDFKFETMVFRADEEGYRIELTNYFLKRYPTAEEALIGHKEVVNGIKNGTIRPKERDVIKDGW